MSLMLANRVIFGSSVLFSVFDKKQTVFCRKAQFDAAHGIPMQIASQVVILALSLLPPIVAQPARCADLAWECG